MALPARSPISPSGIERGVNTDPNTGSVLRDRFHQLRGREYEMMHGTGLGQKVAAEFLASRGAPMTAQNLAIANSYLQGGALGRFEQQQATEDQIANDAVEGVSRANNRSNGSSDVTGSQPQPTGPAQPDATQAPEPSQPNSESSIPWLLPGLLLGAAGTKEGRDLVTRGEAINALDGELVNGVPAVRDPTGAMTRMPAGGGVEDAVVVGVNPAETANALPPPSPDTAPETVTPYAIEDAPIETEDVVPSTEAAPPKGVSTIDAMPADARQNGSVGTHAGPVPIMRSGRKFFATAPDGTIYSATTRDVLKRVLMGLR